MDEPVFRVSKREGPAFPGAAGEFVRALTLEQLIAFLEEESERDPYQWRGLSFKVEVEYLPTFKEATNIRPVKSFEDQ